jgi:hypothetical protein
MTKGAGRTTRRTELLANCGLFVKPARTQGNVGGVGGVCGRSDEWQHGGRLRYKRTRMADTPHIPPTQQRRRRRLRGCCQICGDPLPPKVQLCGSCAEAIQGHRDDDRR